MIIIMEPKATKEQIEKVIKSMENKGFRTNINQGDIMTVIAAIGDKRLMQPQSVASLDGVREVKLIQEPFKLASREGQNEDTIVELENGIKIGGKERPIMMAGPCCVESQEGLLTIAHRVKKAGAKILRGGAFKPRTSPYDFQGLEELGLKYLKEAKNQTGLLIATEVMDTNTVDLVAEYSDIMQVGARNMQNFKLLKALGELGKPVILKRGPASTIREFLLAAEHIMYNGNPNVILCERGIKGIDAQYSRNTFDIAAIPIIKRYSHLPIIVDPSHATGRRYLIEPMTKASLIAGAHGAIVEVHNDPDNALCDGAQSLTMDMFDDMMNTINKLIGLLNYEPQNA